MHFWRNWVSFRFNDGEGIYIKLWDADTNEVLDILDQWISPGGNYAWTSENNEVIVDISEYHDRTVYLTEEIICNDSTDNDELYSELSSIGLLTGILIHPLFIKESEKESKLSIKQYTDAFSKKRKIV